MAGVKGMKRGARKAPIGEPLKKRRPRNTARGGFLSDSPQENNLAFAAAMNRMDPGVEQLRREVETLGLRRAKKQLEMELGDGGFQPLGVNQGSGQSQVQPTPPKPSHAAQLEGLQQQINVLHDLREELAKNVELAHLKINALEDKVG